MIKAVIKTSSVYHSSHQRPAVLILGIGNLLMRDEGIGVRVVEALGHVGLPDGVEVVDGGTAGADLIDLLAQRQKVIVIDALQADQKPGTVLRLQPENILPSSDQSLSLHELGLAETLRMTQYLNCAPTEVVIFAIQPQAVEPGLELSDTVAATIPQIIELVQAELKTST
jgi:hydrogenase maturation protease